MGLACLLAIALSQAIAADQPVRIGASLSLAGHKQEPFVYGSLSRQAIDLVPAVADPRVQQ